MHFKKKLYFFLDRSRAGDLECAVLCHLAEQVVEQSRGAVLRANMKETREWPADEVSFQDTIPRTVADGDTEALPITTWFQG